MLHCVTVTDRGQTRKVKMGRTDEYLYIAEKVAYIYTTTEQKCGHIITKVQRAQKYSEGLLIQPSIKEEI